METEFTTYFNEGQALFNSGNLKSAIKFFTKAKELNPDHF